MPHCEQICSTSSSLNMPGCSTSPGRIGSVVRLRAPALRMERNGLLGYVLPPTRTKESESTRTDQDDVDRGHLPGSFFYYPPKHMHLVIYIRRHPLTSLKKVIPVRFRNPQYLLLGQPLMSVTYVPINLPERHTAAFFTWIILFQHPLSFFETMERFVSRLVWFRNVARDLCSSLPILESPD